MLYKILKNRLPQRQDKDFIKWRVKKKKIKSNELHHLLKSWMGSGKHNDYLLAEVTPELHKQIHYGKDLTDDEFIDLFADNLDYIFEYIEFLKQRIELLQSIIPKIKIEVENES